MDDEGYTSPSEEDFCYNPNNLLRLSVANEEERASANIEDGTPWEIIAKLPCTKNRHLTWDDVHIPLPYRFQRNWIFPGTISSKRLRRTAFIPYCTDSIKKSNEVVDIIWRGWDVVDEDGKERFGQCNISNDADDNVAEDQQAEDSFSNFSTVINDLKHAQGKPKYVSLNTFLQHALHLLAGRNSETFTFTPETLQFKKNPLILLRGIGPTTLANYCEDLLECGSLVTKLNSISKSHAISLFSDNAINDKLVFQTCLDFISNYLKLYQTALMLKGSTLRTLTHLKVFMKPFYSQLRTLENVSNLLSTEGNALDVIRSLNYLFASQETPCIEDLMRGLFITCVSSYCKYVSDWAFRGKLGPPSEFHIEIARENEYTDRRFWTKLFTQKVAIPMFLERSAQLIFETGKSVHLLNRIQKMSTKISPVLYNDTETVIKPQLTFESLEQLRCFWRKNEDSFFEDNSFLQSSLDLSVQSVVEHSFKIFSIDAASVEQAKVEILQKYAAAKLKVNLAQQSKSRELMRDLKEQMNVANERKSEDENLPLYQRMKLRQHLIIDKKNLLEDSIIHSNQEGDVLKIQDVLGKNIDDIKPKEGEGDENVTIDKSPLLKSVLFEEKLFFDEGLLLSGPFLQQDGIEEKFNPDKIIVSEPPKYKSDYSEEFRKPLIPIRQRDAQQVSEPQEFIRYDPYCLNYFLSQSVLIPLTSQNRMINATLLHHLIVENNLFHHVSALNSFLCLQDGPFSYNLSALFIREVTHGGFSNIESNHRKTVRLNMILSQALAAASHVNETDTLTSNLSFSIEENPAKEEKHRSTRESSKYSPLNTIRLHYTVGWPLNIILTDDLLSNYEKIFVFLMQIVRAEMLLDRIFSVINFKKVRSKQLDTIHYCRYRMLHFVRTVRNYVNVTVIDVAWTDLCGSFKKMNSLDKIYDGLVKHIKFIRNNCLHGAKAERLLKLVTDQLVVIENFCDQLENLGVYVDWEKGEEIPADEFKNLIQNFLAAEQIGKVFIGVASKMVQKGYYPKVDYFLKLYNFNGFFSHEVNSVSYSRNETFSEV